MKITILEIADIYRLDFAKTLFYRRLEVRQNHKFVAALNIHFSHVNSREMRTNRFIAVTKLFLLHKVGDKIRDTPVKKEEYQWRLKS